MYHVVTIGDITVDLYFKGESLTINKDRFHLAIGGKYKADYFYQGLGGGAANVAIGCARQGLNTAVYAFVGENIFKQIIIQSLVRKTVSTEFLIYHKNFINISTILLTPKGERTIIHYPTPHTTLGANDMLLKNLLKAENIYLGHLPDVSLNEKIKLIEHFQLAGKRTFLNIGSDDCAVNNRTQMIEFVNMTNVLIINAHEYAGLIGRRYEQIDYKNNNNSKAGIGEDVLVVVTDGSLGSYAYHKGHVFFEPAIKIHQVVDTTGAGDSYASGFISAYITQQNIQQAMKSGSLYASKTIQKIGAN